jgi:cytosine/uracil/thiamine/allantoin permease
VRLVQLQREAVVYITGQNRIRHFFVERAPTIKLAAALFAYWRWSLAEIHGATRPLSSTPRSMSWRLRFETRTRFH